MSGKRRIDRITSETYLDAMPSESMIEIRIRRNDCREEETVLSFERRLLHGRIDILRAELERRAGDTRSLIERLPSILSDEGPQSSRGGYPTEDPILDFDRPQRRVERLVSDDTLAKMTSLTPDEIETIIASLTEAEREVSDVRRTVQRVLDSVNAEIARRYRSGETDGSDLLTGALDA